MARVTAEQDNLADDTPLPRSRRIPPMPRFARILLIIAVILFVAFVALWLQRKPIANGYVQRALTKRGVTASYHIAELGLSHQRLTNLVIGDPAHPDLVADWVELHTEVSLSGVKVTGITAGQVRMRGRLVNGKLSLGQIDRLIPKSTSGGPVSLPSMNVSVADARMHLETPYGLVGLKLSGSGALDDGFSGQLAAVSPRLVGAGCTIDRAAAVVRIRISDSQPAIDGPLRAAAVDCNGVEARLVSTRVDATLGAALDRWHGSVELAADSFVTASGRASGASGSISFDGGPQRTTGSVDLTGRGFNLTQVAGNGLHIQGDYQLGSEGNRFSGSVSGQNARVKPVLIDRVAAMAGGANGTPVGPLIDKLVRAAIVAGRSLDFEADVVAGIAGRNGEVGVNRLIATASSGAQATLSGGNGIVYRWPNAGMTLDGTLALTGGGMPDAVVRLAQARPGAPVTGSAIIRPYAANGAQLALTPVDFSAAANGTTHFSTKFTLSGPLGNGRVDKLTMPLDGNWDGHGRVVLNRRCTPLGFDRLAVSSLVLDAARLTLCPQGNALFTLANGGIDGSARIASPHLTGRIGQTPLDLAASGSLFRLSDNGFHLDNVAARLGQPDTLTRIDLGTLDGRVSGGAVGGSFGGGAGQIGHVPLVMSDAAGKWQLANGELALDGGLRIADAQTGDARRFEPLVSDDFKLSLVNSIIHAAGTLKTPDKGVKVTDVTIDHNLAKGAGSAELDVPGITFAKDFQPETITPLTLGIIANVDGTVKGHGHIEWDAAGVRSNGDFSTNAMNLAAAFGPVQGLSTTIHFTDLLGLVSAPHQAATVAEINAGVTVDNGLVRYQLLSDQRVKVESGAWPFAGGTLTLDPTILDFKQHHERRLTFRLKGVSIAQFVQQFDINNVNATGTFDGVLPMIFDENGGRVEGGHLTARDGGTIAYVGEVSQNDLGTWGNMAFQALRSIRYDHLNIDMNGPLSGEMVTKIRFSGVHQGEGAKSNFILRRLAKLPFVFNIRITAPFRQLLHSVETFYDPSKLDQTQLQTLIDKERKAALDRRNAGKTQADKPVQSPESEDVQ